jgi:glycosyltransferase involved in cell wall biosynthesis
LQQYSHLPYLETIFFATNRGLTSALNAALEKATGSYIMRADPDDLLAPERMELQLNFMQKHPEIDVVGCNVIYFSDKTGKKINTSNFPLSPQKIETTYKKGEHGVQHPTVFAKGDVFRKYRYQPVFPGEDYELFARMIKDGYRFANIGKPLYFMRIHDGSATTNLIYKHICDTFHFRDVIFNTKTPQYRIRNYYHYMRNYRNYQRSGNFFSKYYHLLLAGFYYPRKAFQRLASYFAPPHSID